MANANTTKKTFSRTTEVSIDIDAPADAVWALLVDAKSFPSWNSTVLELDGEIALGQTLKLKSTMAPERVFKLKVKSMDAPKTMVWGDMMGAREYSLQPTTDGTRFSMREKIGGPLFPLFARMIPDFDDAFNTFAADLKKAAER